MAERDYSLPQACPSVRQPHLPEQCGDPLHAIRAMNEAEYANHFAEQHARAIRGLDGTTDPFEAENTAAKAEYDAAQAKRKALDDEIGQSLATEHFDEITKEFDCTVADGLESETDSL
jgi:hypothetical protein